MRYDVLAQDALRGVVRSAVGYACRFGLPGEHHFYITFETTHPEVRLSARLRQKYPREMTIILQHQFWNLQVREDRVAVELSFDNISECLLVPFVAVTGFFDPCVQFGLQFDSSDSDRPARSPITSSNDSALPGAASTSSSALSALVRARVSDAAGETPKTKSQPPPANTSAAACSRVVRLDAFRKKNP